MPQANPYPLRIDKTLFEKFRVIASGEGRSINKQIEVLIKRAVAEYEQEHGLIQLPDQDAEE